MAKSSKFIWIVKAGSSERLIIYVLVYPIIFSFGLKKLIACDFKVMCFLWSMQIKDGFGEGKDLVVSVMSAMGEEQICALKDIGPK